MRRWLDAAWTPAVLLVLAYGIYAMFTQAWPIGWFDLAQQSVFGGYSPKASLLVFVLGALALLAFAWRLLEGLAGPPAAAAAPGAPAATPTAPLRLMLQTGAFMIGLTWVVGLSAAAWVDHRQRGDAAASYRPLRLDDATPATAGDGEHLAVQGVLLADRIVVNRRTMTGTTTDTSFLVPVAGRAWRPGEAVHWVVEAGQLAQLRGPSRGGPGAGWLVQVDGQGPVPAVGRFEAMGVPLAADHHRLRLVAAPGGAPPGEPADPFRIAVWACGLLSAVMVVIAALAAWMIRRR